MKIRTLIYVIILLLVVNVAAISTMVYYRMTPPQAPWGERDMRRNGPPDFEPPKLSASERMAIEQSRQRLDSLIEPILGNIQTARGQLMEELKKDDPDTTKVYQLIGDIGALQSAIQKQMVGQFLSNGGSLRPEQRKRLLRMIEDRTQWQERGRFEGRKKMERKF